MGWPRWAQVFHQVAASHSGNSLLNILAVFENHSFSSSGLSVPSWQSVSRQSLVSMRIDRHFYLLGFLIQLRIVGSGESIVLVDVKSVCWVHQFVKWETSNILFLSYYVFLLLLFLSIDAHRSSSFPNLRCCAARVIKVVEEEIHVVVQVWA